MTSDDPAPGVYVEDTPIAARTITGATTSTTAFLGRAPSGPLDAPRLVHDFADFERIYGGLAPECPLGYAVRQYFTNGGGAAVIARIAHGDPTGAVDPSAPITDADIADPTLAAQQRGLWLLDRIADVNVICIPPLERAKDVGRVTWDAALAYARLRRAFVIIDPPCAWRTASDVTAGIDELVTRDSHGALYFPQVLAPDPLSADRASPFAPCGVIAGSYARTDTLRGVWRAPAGADAVLHGVSGPAAALTDSEMRALNRLAVNALRTHPGTGTIPWGARTLLGADGRGSDWKYVPVRRLALFIEESLQRGTQWAVFEPNDEPLWAQLRLSVGAFLHALFRQGAFQGATAREAYFVRCDAQTTTPTDVGNGVVNIVVGFAPLEPAEFVVLRLALRAGTTPS